MQAPRPPNLPARPARCARVAAPSGREEEGEEEDWREGGGGGVAFSVSTPPSSSSSRSRSSSLLFCPPPFLSSSSFLPLLLPHSRGSPSAFTTRLTLSKSTPRAPRSVATATLASKDRSAATASIRSGCGSAPLSSTVGKPASCKTRAREAARAREETKTAAWQKGAEERAVTTAASLWRCVGERRSGGGRRLLSSSSSSSSFLFRPSLLSMMGR